MGAGGSWAQVQATLDLETPDHSPTCPDCHDLAFPGATVCEGCGAHLLPSPPEIRRMRAPRGCTCEGSGVCNVCVIALYDAGAAL